MDKTSLFRRTSAYLPVLFILLATWAVPSAAAGHPSLGLLIEGVPYGQLHGMGLTHGVVVRGLVTGGPADKAGIRTGDVIVEMNQQPIYTPDQLEWLVAHLGRHAKAKLTFFRDGKQSTTTVEPIIARSGTLAPPGATTQPGEASGQPETGQPAAPPSGLAYLGIGMQPMTEQLGKALGAPGGRGVLIVQVAEGGPAGKAGVRAGDVLIGIGKQAVGNTVDVYRALGHFHPGQTVDLEIVRDKKTDKIPVQLGKAPEEAAPWSHLPWPRAHQAPPMGPYEEYRTPDFGRCIQQLRDCMGHPQEMGPSQGSRPQLPGYRL